MSGHTLRSFCQFGDPAYWYSRGFLRNTYLLWLDRRRPFIVLGVLSSWRWESSLTFAVMMVFRGWQNHHYPAGGCQKLLGGWLVVSLVFWLYRRRRADYSRLSEKAWECPIEHAFGEMSNDCPWNMVRDPVWDDNYRVRTEGRTCHVSIGGVPCEANVACHVYA